MKCLSASLVLLGLVFSMFLTLSYFTSCTSENSGRLQPFAPYHNSCSGPLAVKHINMWTTVFSAILLVALAISVMIIRRALPVETAKFSGRRFIRQYLDRLPMMRRWDPVLVALSDGRLQHGSTNQ